MRPRKVAEQACDYGTAPPDLRAFTRARKRLTSLPAGQQLWEPRRRAVRGDNRSSTTQGCWEEQVTRDEILILIVSGATVLFQDIEKALILLLLFCPGDSNGVGDGTARPSVSAKCQSRVHAQPPMPLPAARQNCATPQRGASWQQPGLPQGNSQPQAAGL